MRLADVLQRHGGSFLAERGKQLSPQQWQAWRSIIQCRTPALGGHVHACAKCGGGRHHVYHSCNHRLCPECGGQRAREWLGRQEDSLLPVPYFMVTFTTPGTLHGFMQQQEAFWYEALFACSSAVLMEMARERKCLQGEAAFLGVLHSWRRDLGYHPHIHCIMPGGVLHTDEDGVQSWHPAGAGRKHDGKDYLFNVGLLSIKMRIKMEGYVREHDPELFARVPWSVWRQEWVTHIQPAGNARHTLRYLARYVTKSALGKGRILSDDERGVRFTYTPQGEKKARVMTLSPHDFIWRVLQHALPKGFKRVRYYGWLHPAAKKRLHRVQNLLCVPVRMGRPEDAATGTESVEKKPRHTCKDCGGTQFVSVGKLAPRRFIRLAAGRGGTPGATAPPAAAATGEARAPP